MDKYQAICQTKKNTLFFSTIITSNTYIFCTSFSSLQIEFLTKLKRYYWIHRSTSITSHNPFYIFLNNYHVNHVSVSTVTPSLPTCIRFQNTLFGSGCWLPVGIFGKWEMRKYSDFRGLGLWFGNGCFCMICFCMFICSPKILLLLWDLGLRIFHSFGSLVYTFGVHL